MRTSLAFILWIASLGGQATASKSEDQPATCSIPAVGVSENGNSEYFAVDGGFAPGEVREELRGDLSGVGPAHYKGCSSGQEYSYDGILQEDDPQYAQFGSYEVRCRTSNCELGPIATKGSNGEAGLTFGVHVGLRGFRFCQTNGGANWRLSVRGKDSELLTAFNLSAASCLDEEGSGTLLGIMKRGVEIEAIEENGARSIVSVYDLEEVLRLVTYLRPKLADIVKALP